MFAVYVCFYILSVLDINQTIVIKKKVTRLLKEKYIPACQKKKKMIKHINTENIWNKFAENHL